MRYPFRVAPGLYSDDTTLEKTGHWADGSNARFRLGQPQSIGGWESVTGDLLTGVCRSIFPWTDNSAVLNVAFGTHSALQVYTEGGLATITPSGLAAGEIDGTGSAGYGTGGYGVGGYGSPSASDYYPRTWSFSPWGEQLRANPRNGTIYGWANDTSTLATAITNAPAQVTYMVVAPTRQLFAFGCNEEVSGTFNPLCIRHSSVEDDTEWNTSPTTTAREYILTGGGRIVGARVVGSYILVWTDNALFLGQFLGSVEQPWRFDQVGRNCGLVGPMAVVIVGQSAFWFSVDRQFYAYSLGGEPQPMACPIRQDMADNLALAQGDKIVASSIKEFSEIRWDYPDDRDGHENSRYVAVCISGPDAGSWYRGQMARTAMVDAGPSPNPIGVTYGGNIYWHERGQSADGSVLAWFIESADQYLSEGRQMMVRGVWPDFKSQVGGIDCTVTVRDYPQGSESTQAQTLAVGDDKADYRITGRLAKVKFSGSTTPAFARLGTPIFDLVPAGGR